MLSSTMEKTLELFHRQRSSACLFASSRHSRSVMLRPAGTGIDVDDDLTKRWGSVGIICQGKLFYC